MTVAEFATKRVVSTTMILVFMVFAGYMAIRGMKQELIPDFEIPVVVVNTKWTGASSGDVKTQISDKIEEAALNVDGIKNISTTSTFGTSVVTMEFNYGVDTDIKQVQIQTEVDKIKSDLPSDDNFSDPVVSKIDTGGGNSDMALMIGVKGADEALITSFIDETMEPRLKRNRGIGNISVLGSTKREIKVELDPYKLQAYNLSPPEIYSKIKDAHTVSPAGTVTDGTKEFILRVNGEIRELEQIQNIIISNNNNQTLKLSDIANVHYGTKDRESYLKYNGEDMVGVIIQKSKDGNLVEIADISKKSLEELKPLLPAGASYEILVDNSEDVKSSISNVTSTGIQALIIAVIVLLLFLKDIRASIVVGLSIPISAMFTFFLLRTQGISLNLISLMGLALAIGSLVDNAVVTLDNIFDHIQVNKEPPLIAAVRGTNEVILPMIASTATSVCVFLPIVIQEGMTKEVFKSIAFSMMFALSASIIVAMLFVPLAASRFLNMEKIIKSAENSHKFNAFKEKYKELVTKALSNRKKVVFGVFILFMVVVLGLGRTVKTAFFPTIDNKEYAVVASLSTGLNLEVSHEISKKMEEIIKSDPLTKNTNVIVSESAAIVNVDVTKDTYKAMNRIREKLKDLPNVNLTLVPEKAGGSSVTKDYSFNIEGENEDELNRIANSIIAEMRSQSWFKDIKSSTEGGYPQARLEVNRVKAESYGINVTTLTNTLSMSVLGLSPIEIIEGTESLDVKIELEKEYKNSLEKIMELEIKASDGTFVRVADIATLEQVESPSTISTKNGSKIVTVGTNLDSSKGFNDAAKFIGQAFKKSNPAIGYKLTTSGNAESQREMGGQIMTALMMSIALIYTVLAIQLESFVLPLMIMTTLPLSMIGVIFGLAITRVQMSMFVMIGILMLFGMAVNNAIVLLDFVSGLRTKGVPIREAIIDACGSRLRPILMTTLTTVLGWIPMALALGGGSAGYYQGMAIAVMFGLSFCTFLTLFFIPVTYSLVEERKERKNKEKEEKKKARKLEERAKSI